MFKLSTPKTPSPKTSSRPIAIILSLLTLIGFAIYPTQAPASPATFRFHPQMRVEPLEAAITPIPLEDVRGFLYEGAIFDKRCFYERAPYVVEIHHKWEDASPGDLIFARNMNAPPYPEEPVFAIYQPGRCYYEPCSREFLGFEAEKVGEAERVKGGCDYAFKCGNSCMCYSPEELLRLGDPTVLRVTAVHDTIPTIMVGAKVFPKLATNYPPYYYPKPAKITREGFILSVRSGMDVIGLHDTVVISLGCREGLEEGALLDIYSAANYVVDTVRQSCLGSWDRVLIPELRIGTMMVYRTYEKLSLALVMECNDYIHMKDIVRSPQLVFPPDVSYADPNFETRP